MRCEYALWLAHRGHGPRAISEEFRNKAIGLRNALDFHRRRLDRCLNPIEPIRESGFREMKSPFVFELEESTGEPKGGDERDGTAHEHDRLKSHDL
jgi:hypothetical protein